MPVSNDLQKKMTMSKREFFKRAKEGAASAGQVGVNSCDAGVPQARVPQQDPMRIVPVPLKIASASAVLFGPYGAVTGERGHSRLSL
jgi:hypothetical protein